MKGKIVCKSCGWEGDSDDLVEDCINHSMGDWDDIECKMTCPSCGDDEFDHAKIEI